MSNNGRRPFTPPPVFHLFLFALGAVGENCCSNAGKDGVNVMLCKDGSSL